MGHRLERLIRTEITMRKRLAFITASVLLILFSACVTQNVISGTGTSHAAELEKNHRTYSKFKVIKTIKRSDVRLRIKDRGSSSLPTSQAMAYLGKGKIATVQNNVSGRMEGSRARIRLYKKSGKLKKQSGVMDLGHSNGLTYHDGTLYCAKGHGSNRRIEIDARTLKYKRKVDMKWELSAIAYDVKTGRFSIGSGDHIYRLNENMTKSEKKIMRKKPYYGAQDQAYHKGVVYCCVSVDKHRQNYISMYDDETGKYYGSYAIGFDAELEDCEVAENGCLYILIHKKGTKNNYVYKTKKKLALQ